MILNSINSNLQQPQTISSQVAGANQQAAIVEKMQVQSQALNGNLSDMKGLASIRTGIRVQNYGLNGGDLSEGTYPLLNTQVSTGDNSINVTIVNAGAATVPARFGFLGIRDAGADFTNVLPVIAGVTDTATCTDSGGQNCNFLNGVNKRSVSRGIGIKTFKVISTTAGQLAQNITAYELTSDQNLLQKKLSFANNTNMYQTNNDTLQIDNVGIMMDATNAFEFPVLVGTTTFVLYLGFEEVGQIVRVR